MNDNVTQIDKKKTNSKWDAISDYVTALSKKVGTQQQLSKSVLMMLKTMDSKMDALRDVMVAKAVATDQEIDAAIDANIGLRLREDNEDICLGDVVWVNYSGTIDGGKEFKQENFPIRVGSNTVIFEQALVGRRPNTMGVTHDATFKGGEYAGKTIKFNIDIYKVKTQVVGANDDAGYTDIGASQGEPQPNAEADGSGHDAGGGGESQSIQ